MKYQKILKQKDSQINHLQNSDRQNYPQINFASNSFIFNLRKYKTFFNDWIIFDSLDSVNGPSNWNIKKIKSEITKKNKIILLQSSIISTGKYSKPSTSIQLRKKIQLENIYFKIIFISKFSGEIFINFKHFDIEHYMQLQLIRESETKGKILILMKIKRNNILYWNRIVRKWLPY